jgi:hypothetical protein
VADRSPGEPVGCLALLVGLVALLVVATATGPGRRLLGSVAPGAVATLVPGAGASAVEEQRQALDVEAEALREEARRLREERMTARKERMLAIAARHREGERRQYHRIRLDNRCRYAIAVALYYRDLDLSFVTRGWWEVAPGATMTTDAMTRDPEFYLYAENRAVGRTWDGAGQSGAIAREIGDEKFDQLDGEPLLFREPRTASFARRDTGAEWADAVETFECPVEETPPPGAVVRAPSAEQGPRNP